MPVLARPATAIHRSWNEDSARWSAYRPRAGEVVIATYPKCGTTWMRRIVGMLIHNSTDPLPIDETSVWLDHRLREPLEIMAARLEERGGRRILTSHVPFDAMPIYDDVQYIHVARHGLDAFMSWHNHITSLRPAVLAGLDRAGLDDPEIGRLYPRVAEIHSHYRSWLSDGYALPDFFDFENTYWLELCRPNVLFVHYSDMLADLGAETRRIAAFLDIDMPGTLWRELVETAGFNAMRRDGEKLLPAARDVWSGGANRFFFRGGGGRWRAVLSAEEVSGYHAHSRDKFLAGLADWIESGAGDGRHAATDAKSA